MSITTITMSEFWASDIFRDEGGVLFLLMLVS